MSNWEEEVEELFKTSNQETKCFDGVLYNGVKELLAKQRNQLLDEVKEKVIGEYERDINVVNHKTGEVEPDFNAHDRNIMREQQLKKLAKLKDK